MLRKVLAGAALAAASLTMVAPTASAAPASVYAGVYPDQNSAIKACNLGIVEGRWTSCFYRETPDIAPQVELWVQINSCEAGCRD